MEQKGNVMSDVLKIITRNMFSYVIPHNLQGETVKLFPSHEQFPEVQQGTVQCGDI